MSTREKIAQDIVARRYRVPRLLTIARKTVGHTIPENVRRENLPLALFESDEEFVFERRRKLVKIFALYNPDGRVFRDTSLLSLIRDTAREVVAQKLLTRSDHDTTVIDTIRTQAEIFTGLMPEEDALFLSSWIMTSFRLESDINDFETRRRIPFNFSTYNVIVTLINAIYDMRIDLDTSAKYEFLPAGSSRHRNRNSIKIGSEIFEISSTLMVYIIALVSSYANMLGQPEQHKFSLDCRCYKCSRSEEYFKLLQTKYVLPATITYGNSDESYVFIVQTDVMSKILEMVHSGATKFLPSYPVLVYNAHGRAARTTRDRSSIDRVPLLVEYLNTYYPNDKGIMFRVPDISEYTIEDIILMVTRRVKSIDYTTSTYKNVEIAVVIP